MKIHPPPKKKAASNKALEFSFPKNFFCGENIKNIKKFYFSTWEIFKIKIFILTHKC
jgi:hypothetical protein